MLSPHMMFVIALAMTGKNTKPVYFLKSYAQRILKKLTFPVFLFSNADILSSVIIQFSRCDCCFRKRPRSVNKKSVWLLLLRNYLFMVWTRCWDLSGKDRWEKVMFCTGISITLKGVLTPRGVCVWVCVRVYVCVRLGKCVCGFQRLSNGVTTRNPSGDWCKAESFPAVVKPEVVWRRS